jgi:son of sevenless
VLSCSQAFRTFLKRVDPPCIPYIGMYLTDLTFMEEGISNNTGDLINFSKRWKVAAVIQDIQQYQQAPYHFHKLGVIQDYLTNAQVGVSVPRSLSNA